MPHQQERHVFVAMAGVQSSLPIFVPQKGEKYERPSRERVNQEIN